MVTREEYHGYQGAKKYQGYQGAIPWLPGSNTMVTRE